MQDLSQKMQDYNQEYEIKWYSDNPFVRLSYYRHKEYMEELALKK
jgi:hypothetical protein